MNHWNDFNSADDQNTFDVIPKGTLAKVRMTIRPGGFDDAAQGWNAGYATQSPTTGAVYLNCEFVVIEGPYAKRKLWSLIGLHSQKGPEWANMGRTFIKGVLNSARALHPQDNSPKAQQARCIESFAALDGIEFVARIEIEKNLTGEDKNNIKTAVTPDHKDYAAIMGTVSSTLATTAETAQRTQAFSPSVSSPSSASSAPAQPQAKVPTGRPSWAQ
ncbi:hypothetical protein AB833_04070 [Chromatiales bacterium (ex Bugula neritina AB1)]|nr:hypothetical protein AB833_04070 [Chromatiales bacterium (ex Bugula neritina AB1)]